MFVYSLDGLKMTGGAAMDVEIEDNEHTARSGVYNVLAGFFTLPDPEAHAAAVAGGWPAQLREAGEMLAFEFDFGAAALANSVEGSAFETEYVRLFGGPGTPAASIFAGDYGEGERMDRIAELTRQFEYYGLAASDDKARSPDHLATECEFMQYLAFKEAASSSKRLAGSYHRAQEGFIERHLASWLPAFSEKVEQAQGLPIYVWVSQTAVRFVEADLAYLRS